MLCSHTIVLRPWQRHISVHNLPLSKRGKHKIGFHALLLGPSDGVKSLRVSLGRWPAVPFARLHSNVLFHLLFPQSCVTLVVIRLRDRSEIGLWRSRWHNVQLRLIVTRSLLTAWCPQEVWLLLSMRYISRNAHGTQVQSGMVIALVNASVARTGPHRMRLLLALESCFHSRQIAVCLQLDLMWVNVTINCLVRRTDRYSNKSLSDCREFLHWLSPIHNQWMIAQLRNWLIFYHHSEPKLGLRRRLCIHFWWHRSHSQGHVAVHFFDYRATVTRSPQTSQTVQVRCQHRWPILVRRLTRVQFALTRLSRYHAFRLE